MTKQYEIQVKFGKTWAIVEKTNLHKDALDYVRKAGNTTYPFRIVRVVKTIVFEGD